MTDKSLRSTAAICRDGKLPLTIYLN